MSSAAADQSALPPTLPRVRKTRNRSKSKGALAEELGSLQAGELEGHEHKSGFAKTIGRKLSNSSLAMRFRKGKVMQQPNLDIEPMPVIPREKRDDRERKLNQSIPGHRPLPDLKHSLSHRLSYDSLRQLFRFSTAEDQFSDHHQQRRQAVTNQSDHSFTSESSCQTDIPVDAALAYRYTDTKEGTDLPRRDPSRPPSLPKMSSETYTSFSKTTSSAQESDQQSLISRTATASYEYPADRKQPPRLKSRSKAIHSQYLRSTKSQSSLKLKFWVTESDKEGRWSELQKSMPLLDPMLSKKPHPTLSKRKSTEALKELFRQHSPGISSPSSPSFPRTPRTPTSLYFAERKSANHQESEELIYNLQTNFLQAIDTPRPPPTPLQYNPSPPMPPESKRTDFSFKNKRSPSPPLYVSSIDSDLFVSELPQNRLRWRITAYKSEGNLRSLAQ